nr:hypothetical protein [uncultured Pseudomonas sp.]
MKKSNKTSKSRKREQSSLSRVLASSKYASKVHKYFFEKLEPFEIRASVPRLVRHQHFKRAILLTRERIADRYLSQTPDASIKKNLSWCLGVLEVHKEQVSYYLEKEKSVEACLLKGDVVGALESLDSIDDKCGLSMWSIGIRGSLLSYAGRQSDKQDFLQEIFKEAGDNRFFKNITTLISNRFEAGDILSAESDFSEQKIKRTYSGSILHFLMYKLLPMSVDFKYNFEEILNFEKNTTAIDIYICVVDAVIYSAAKRSDDLDDKECASLLAALLKMFDGSVLRGLGGYYGLDVEWTVDELDYRLLDSYTCGNYEAVAALAEVPHLLQRFTNFSLVARSACRSPVQAPGLIGELLTWTSSVVSKDENYADATTKLSAMVHAFATLPWFRNLHFLNVRETKHITSSADKAIEAVSVVISEVNSPAKITYFQGGVREKYRNALSENVGDSPVFNLFNFMLDSSATEGCLPPALDYARKEKYLAIKALKNREYKCAIRKLQVLMSSKDRLISNDACKLIIPAYLSVGDIEAAITTYVDVVSVNPSLLNGMNSSSVSKACESITAGNKSISVPVALSLHSRFVDDEFNAALKYSFERFVVNNGCSNPVELFDTCVSESPYFNYFMEYVCTPEVMKLYLFFNTVKEIEACRIEICKRLIERSCSIESMRFEVKERTRKLVILDATKHVENSRIYSDTSGFVTSNDFRQLYERYLKLRLNDYSSTNDEVYLSHFLETMKGGEDIILNAHVIHVQDLALNEKNLAFLKLIKLIRDDFAFGPKGFSGYLGTRIKHGHFPTTLRKCAADEGLISPKTSTTGSYKKNKYWIDQYGFLPPASQVDFDKVLADFSSRFDELINSANDDWLKIKIIDQDLAGFRKEMLEDEAKFNYSISYFESYILQSRLSDTSSYNDFVKLITEWLWARTENNLSRVRSKIADYLREKLYRLLDQLESESLAVVKDQNRLAIFNDSVGRARAKLTSSIDTIISWFSRSQGLSVDHFDSDIAVEIARLSAGAEINYKDTTGVQFQGGVLTYMVDILYVLLDNCVTKSNLSKEALMVNGSLRKENDTAVLVVENNCFPVSDFLQANANLNFYRENYGKEQVMIKASQGVGKTGVFKIWKALSKDLDLDHSIEFGYSSPTSFRVTLNINNISKVIHS